MPVHGARTAGGSRKKQEEAGRRKKSIKTRSGRRRAVRDLFLSTSSRQVWFTCCSVVAAPRVLAHRSVPWTVPGAGVDSMAVLVRCGVVLCGGCGCEWTC